MKRFLLLTILWVSGAACGSTGDPGRDDEVVEDLIFMRQEEKLARDVYLTLGDVWDARVFDNIAGSEQTHMDKVLDLLKARGEEDPVGGLGIGEYQDAEFVTLYETLVARGMQSRDAAFQVGVDIENLDIVDLAQRIEKQPPADVASVYEALRSGSYNHLDAFTRQLNR